MKLEINNKKVYVVSDIHNDADGFKKLLKQIHFAEEDVLIIAGDIFDRGNKPVELYFEILNHSNIYAIQGNHDYWLSCFIREKYCNEKVGRYLKYNSLGILEKRLTPMDLTDLANWINAKPYYIELTLDGKHYQIAHAQTYDKPEMISNPYLFYMGDYDYYDCFITGEKTIKDCVSIVGHTPTLDSRINFENNGSLIRIDCGNGYKSYDNDTALGAIRLNDLQEFYILNT